MTMTLDAKAVRETFDRDGVVHLPRVLTQEWVNLLELGIKRNLQYPGPYGRRLHEGTEREQRVSGLWTIQIWSRNGAPITRTRSGPGCPTSKPSATPGTSSRFQTNLATRCCSTGPRFMAAVLGTRARKTLSLRLFGDDVCYSPRPGRPSPQCPDVAEMHQRGDPLRSSWFPRVLPRPEPGWW